MSTLKTIKSSLKRSCNKQNLTLAVISYEIYETRRRPFQGQGQMSNTNKYCLEFLLTTYDITIVNETTQCTHIIVHLDILQGNNEV